MPAKKSTQETLIARPEIRKPSFWAKLKKKLGYIISGTLVVAGMAVLMFVPVVGATAILIHDLALIPIIAGAIGTTIAGVNSIKDKKALERYYQTLKEIERSKTEGCIGERKRILKLHKTMLKCKLRVDKRFNKLKASLSANRWIDNFEEPQDNETRKFAKLATLHQLDSVNARLEGRDIKGGLRPVIPPFARNQKRTRAKYQMLASDESRQDIFGTNTSSPERRIEVLTGVPVLDPRTGVKTYNDKFIKKFEKIQEAYKGTINTSPYTHMISVMGLDDFESYEFKSNSEKILSEAAKALCGMVKDQEFVIVEAETKCKGRTGETTVGNLSELKKYFGIETSKKKNGVEKNG